MFPARVIAVTPFGTLPTATGSKADASAFSSFRSAHGSCSRPRLPQFVFARAKGKGELSAMAVTASGKRCGWFAFEDGTFDVRLKAGHHFVHMGSSILPQPFAFFDERRMAKAIDVLRRISPQITQVWLAAQQFDDPAAFDMLLECSIDTMDFQVAGNGQGH